MKKPLVSFTAIICCSAIFADTMTITPMDSPENLAKALLGDGIQITNVSFQGSNVSAGYFSGGNKPNIGLDSGIVLTTGNASFAGMKNIAGNTGANVNGAGYGKLTALTGGIPTYDATVLSISFIAQGDSAYFNYVFASDEYVEYANSSFNDAFGFFIDDANYALIPGTEEPVTINNVNNVDHPELFNNNDPWKGGATEVADVTYDGYTNAFTAAVTGLVAGNEYTIDMAIADAGDHVYDSAVFIDAGSFSTAPVTPSGAPEPSILILLAVAGVSLVAAKSSRAC